MNLLNRGTVACLATAALAVSAFAAEDLKETPVPEAVVEEEKHEENVVNHQYDPSILWGHEEQHEKAVPYQPYGAPIQDNSRNP